MSDEMFYVDDSGARRDEDLHASMLSGKREPVRVARLRARSLGLTEDEARALYPAPRKRRVSR